MLLENVAAVVTIEAFEVLYGQGIEKAPAVGFRLDTGVEYDDVAGVLVAANQAADALAELN